MRQSGRSDDVCYVWRLLHICENTMFTLQRNRYVPTVKRGDFVLFAKIKNSAHTGK